jgi:RNA polymerase sigma-70 factor (ECF subfamily)
LNQLSDKEIIEKVLKGNHELFGLIIDRYERPVAATIKGLLGDCPEAEEVGQDTFIRCFQSLAKFRGESTLKTYLIRIALNLSLNELKRRKRMLNRVSRLDDVNFIEAAEDKVHEQNEIKDLIHKAMEQLEVKQRSVLVLRVIEGYNTAETAKILKIPVGTVLSRLSRAQENMKKILSSVRY